MLRREIIAVIALVFILLGIPATAWAVEKFGRAEQGGLRVITVDMSAPEAGGFSPDIIDVDVGETVILRFRSRDVTHGVAIGPGTGIDIGQVDPGHVVEVPVTFDHPGTYTYYCNTWCSVDHWRMRGVIQVHDPAQPGLSPAAETDPVIDALLAAGIDIDAGLHTGSSDHETEHSVDQAMDMPSPERGETIAQSLVVPEELTSIEWRRSHSINDAAALLSVENPQSVLSIGEFWDVAAYLWLMPDADSYQSLYEKNCAACHGQWGDGDGPAADQTAEDPVTFTDAAHMLDMRSDVLYAKIRRGGMGTDMPNFGTLFTREETWGLVDYIWMLAFTYESHSQ